MLSVLREEVAVFGHRLPPVYDRHTAEAGLEEGVLKVWLGGRSGHCVATVTVRLQGPSHLVSKCCEGTLSSVFSSDNRPSRDGFL